MIGTIVSVDSVAGARVEQGATLLSIESMKMEYPVVAPVTGMVERINVSVGDLTEENQVLLVISP
jgi:biotin carboxyl carrier protein